MKRLIKCVFCNQTISLKELGLNDKDIGPLCKNCFTWLNEDFLKKWRQSTCP